ncbi:hypothetical protein EK21DRAFT_19502, partial [Setomelanomma holmii]
ARLLARRGREKPQLSCNFCRRRKLRCDRKQPCDSCIRLGQASICSFPASQASPAKGATQNQLQERIEHLESLVRSLVPKQEEQSDVPTIGTVPDFGSGTTTTDFRDNLASDFGRINLQSQDSSYVESDHWSAILDEISDLKDMVSDQTNGLHGDSGGDLTSMPGTDLFLSSLYPTTKMEVIAALPPRIVVDSLVTKYFESADMPVTLILHRKVFLKQYEAFWNDPLATSVMWLTILFGMLSMVAYTTLLSNGGPDELDEQSTAEYKHIVTTSRVKMIQCLRQGNYLKGMPHTIEALLFMLQVEYIQGEDRQQGCWYLVGTIVRVALKMGYHRDGSHFPEMSIYEQEMRRRTWYILMQFDIASASQVGLPRIIKQAQCDTAEPSNLLDDDFDDITTALPSLRPETEHTLSQFLVYKTRIVSVYGMICDFTTSSQQRDYGEAMRLDALLKSAYTNKPSILELRPMQSSITDGTDLATRRLYMAMSFYHAQMTLHRKFMIHAKTNSKYALSLTECVDAALAALQLQSELFEQCQPGRMLYAHRWKILSLIQSEFLLATTILCFNLNDDVVHTRRPNVSLYSDEKCQQSVEALRASLDIWEQQQDISKEARTAVQVISVVLSKAQEYEESR